MEKYKDIFNLTRPGQYQQSVEEWQDLTPIKRIVKITIGGGIIGTMVGAYNSFVHELPVIPANSTTSYSLFKNLSYLGRHVATVSAVAFTYQFSKEIISSFKGKDTVHAYFGSGFLTGLAAGAMLKNIKRGFILGGILGSLLSLIAHMPDSQTVRLREVLNEKREATEIMSTLNTIEHQNEREARRIEEMEKYEKL